MIRLKRLFLKVFLKILALLPIKKNKIIFSSYHGSSYACNPRYISEALERKYKDLVDIVWILPQDVEVPEGIRKIQEHSLKGIYELVTAKVWVDNCRKSIWLTKRKGQYYIQTWHAGIGLKKCERAAQASLPNDYIEAAKNDSEMADLFLSGSKWLTELYRKDFWYDGIIWEKGLPREDILSDNHTKFHKQICDFYNVPESTKFILYAPTFRDSGKFDAYDINYHNLLKSICRTGESWKIIVRLHPNIRDNQEIIKYDADILNGSQYSEINELILASEYFISDYSSCIFDAMLAKCKVILYASDIDLYKKERGYLFEWEDLPFILTRNNKELEKAFLEFDEKEYSQRIEKFSDKCGIIHPGNAAEMVADHIMSIIENSK